MFRAAKRRRPTGPVAPRVRRRGDLGLQALAVTPEPTASGPATTATWAWSLRRFGRWMVVCLPLYAVISGLVSLGTRDRGTSGLYLPDEHPLYLFPWLVAVWLGLMAQVALAALLAATRTRRAGLAGFMVSTGGVFLMLPFAGLPGATTVYGMDAGLYLLAGATLYSLGWTVTGSAVGHSGVFSYGDGVLLMLAAPLLGVAGLLVGTLQTVGATLAFAAGLGTMWRAGRLLPVGHRGIAAAAAAQAATAAAAAADAVTTAAADAVTTAAAETAPPGGGNQYPLATS
jgi:hypothetical protein